MNKRKVHLDLLRVIAIILVLYNHLHGSTAYMREEGVLRMVYMAGSAVTRANVPIFLMISGALLLKKNYEYTNKEYWKKIFRFIAVLLVFEIVVYLEYCKLDLFYDPAYQPNFKDFIYGLAANSIEETYSYWYIYTYICFLLMLPLLQRVALHMKKADFYVILTIHFLLVSYVPCFNVLLNHYNLAPIILADSITVPLAVTNAIFFPLMGHYLDNCLDIKQVKIIGLLNLMLITAISVMLTCGLTYREGRIDGYGNDIIQHYDFDYVVAIFIFVLVKYLVTKREESLNHKDTFDYIVVFVGKLTFGIYLLDPVLKGFLYYNRYLNIHFASSFTESLGWIFVSMFLGGIITWILKKTHIFSRIL